MESNWRLNVWRLGCTTMTTPMLAELRVPIGFFTHIGHIAADQPGLCRYWLDLSLFLQNAPWGFSTVPFLVSGGFPHGIDVLPD